MNSNYRVVEVKNKSGTVNQFDVERKELNENPSRRTYGFQLKFHWVFVKGFKTKEEAIEFIEKLESEEVKRTVVYP